jgi:hypothetical protein
VQTTETITKKIISSLDSAMGPGITEIPIKIIKNSDNLIPILIKLFNTCIATNTIPTEWKFAVVTPLYKNES